MGISRRRIWVTAAASLATMTAVAGMTLASSPAFAASPVRAVSHQSISRPGGGHTVRPASGWIGQCYPQINANNETGWCDGNGPDYHYYAYVDCSDGYEYYGVDRWAGDRRGSQAICPSGTFAVRGGLYWYFV